MRLLRGMLGLLIWILAAVLSLVSVVLCVTVLLLPLGIPLLLLSKRMFGLGLRLMTSRKVTHPIDELRKATAESMPSGKTGKRARKNATKAADRTRDLAST